MAVVSHGPRAGRDFRGAKRGASHPSFYYLCWLCLPVLANAPILPEMTNRIIRGEAFVRKPKLFGSLVR